MDKNVLIINNLKEKIENIGINGSMSSISSLYVQTISDLFGEENIFTKKAIGLASGWEVDGAWLHVNGLISDAEFKKNTFNSYISLLNEILVYFELNDIDESDKKIMFKMQRIYNPNQTNQRFLFHTIGKTPM